MINIRTKEEIYKMEKAAAIVRDLLFTIESLIKPGISTLQLDDFSEEYIINQGAIPGFKGLYGFDSNLRFVSYFSTN